MAPSGYLPFNSNFTNRWSVQTTPLKLSQKSFDQKYSRSYLYLVSGVQVHMYMYMYSTCVCI